MEFFSFLLQASFSAAVAIIVIALLRVLLKNKLDRRAFIFLWTFVVFCLFVSPFVSSSLNFSQFFVEHNIVTVGEFLPNSGEVIEKVEQMPVQAGIVDFNPIKNMITPPKQVIPISFTVWLVGMTVLLTSISLLYALFYRQCQKALPVHNTGYEDYLNGTKVYLNDQISSPVTIGFFKPQIHLPVGIDLQEKEAVKHILFHELTHIKRRDNLFKLVMLLALSLHWFNPFVWLLFRLFNKDLEFSCDTATLAQIGQENKAKYANTLVTMAERRQEANVAGLVFVSFEGNFLKERVLNIMDAKSSKVLSLVFTVVLALGVFTIFATNAQPINANVAQANVISVDQARSIALEKVGGGQVVKTELDYEKHGAEYEVLVVQGEMKYEVDINAYNSSVIKIEKRPIDQIKIAVTSDMISPAKAKEYAINQTGTGVVVDCELEYEDGVAIYEVEVMKDNVKYEYTINAVTSAILKSEVKHYYLP